MLSMQSKAAALLFVAMGSGMARAADDGSSMFKVSGFGTVAAVHSSQEKADWAAMNIASNGAGHTHAWDVLSETRLGVQLDARLSDSLSGVVQVLSEHRYNGSFTPTVKMANIKWQVTPGIDARFGRVPLPMYPISEYLHIGYALPWVRAPHDIYTTKLHLNGGDLRYTSQLGDDWALTLHGYAGNLNLKTAHAGMVRVENLRGASVTAESGASSYRVGYSFADVTIDDHPALQDTFARVRAMPGGSAVAGKYDGAHRKPYYTLAYTYDPGTWLLMAEWTSMRRAGDFAGKYTAAYVTLGRHIGSFLPYLTLSRMSPASQPGSGNPVMDAALAGLNVGERSFAAGVRWDFMKGVDLKVQLDHLILRKGSDGHFINLQVPVDQLDRHTNLLSVAVDFVF